MNQAQQSWLAKAQQISGRVALAGIVALSVGLTACSGGGGGAGSGTVVKAEAGYKFSPANLTVKTGTPVEVTLDNVDSIAHDWVVNGVNGAKIPEIAGKRKSAAVKFTAPAPGNYKIVCTLPGHEEAGMVGQLTVTP